MNEIAITEDIELDLNEVELSAMRAQGAGGQNVNKVSSAIHLRFDIKNSSLPEFLKERLLMSKDSRITQEGELILKAQRFRTQSKNREDAIARLVDILAAASVVPKTRKASRPSLAAKRKRLDNKAIRAKTKAMRKPVDY